MYPLEIYLAVGRAQGIAAGVYRYAPATHELIPVAAGGAREALAVAAMGQQWLAQAPVVFAIGAVETRTTGKYGARGTRFVHIEVEHVAQKRTVAGRGPGTQRERRRRLRPMIASQENCTSPPT